MAPIQIQQVKLDNGGVVFIREIQAWSHNLINFVNHNCFIKYAFFAFKSDA